jgi:alpha-L-fucosidase
VSIRPGWFYHAAEDARVKKPAELLDIYYKSVGRGACLNLNLPPDRRGRIHENDVAALRGFRRLLDATFARNLAKDARWQGGAERPGAGRFAPGLLLDGDRGTYWSTPDETTSAELVLELPEARSFDVVELREHLPLGQRVEAFAIDVGGAGGWREVATGSSIGNRRLLRLPEKVTTERVRLRVVRAAACPALSEFGLYAEP